MKKIIWIAAVVGLLATAALGTELPPGYATLDETQPLLEKTLRVHLAPDISALTQRERETVQRLVEVGAIFQGLHETMRHRQAVDAHRALVALDARLGSPPATRNLLALYYSGKGPVVRGLDNRRRPILPVDAPVPGGSVYPWGVTRDEIDAYLTAHPETRASILHPRTVVRRLDSASLKKDRSTLAKHPALDLLHPGLRASLDALRPDPKGFYAVPYSVAWATELTKASGLLSEAASLIAPEDEDFAAYLRNRARDLLTDDYEAGDAAWVCGRFKNLNAQIGSYETYDDELYGVKTYFSLNVLTRDHARSDALRQATRELQALEDSLPYDDGREHKRVRTDIPVGVYDVVVDFAQSRGGNTATILPNDANMARKYGRTILLRRNIMTQPDLFEMQRTAYVAAVAEEFAHHLTPEANANRTLWHEIGHYLGVDRTREGRDLDDALEHASSVYEEMKADLVSLYLSAALEKMGYYDAETRRALFASGVRRVLLKNRPERSQVYQTMELMQLNYFLEKGALSFDAGSGRLSIDYERFPAAVGAMLRETLEIQAAGDRDAAEAFITRHTGWRDDLHERLAEAMRAAETYRFAYVTYELLESAE